MWWPQCILALIDARQVFAFRFPPVGLLPLFIQGNTLAWDYEQTIAALVGAPSQDGDAASRIMVTFSERLPHPADVMLERPLRCLKLIGKRTAEPRQQILRMTDIQLRRRM